MIDLKLLRASPDQVRAALARRGDASITRLLDELEALDIRRRALTGQLDQLKAERNAAAQVDARLMKEKGELPADVRAQRKQLGERIAGLDVELRNLEIELERKALFVPNLPLPESPDGDASHNKIVRTWGEPAPAGGPPHWEIAESLGILDLVRGAKLAGSGFPVFVGAGARLVRALINFMLDLHTREHGYVEVEPPLLARREIMTGTGQLPKFADDAYRTEPDDLFLIPTAEVPVTNLLRDEIVDGATLPRGYVAYTPCFRREAGARARTRAGCCGCISSTKWSSYSSAVPRPRRRSTSDSRVTPRKCCDASSSPIGSCCSRRGTWGSPARKPTISRCGRRG